MISGNFFSYIFTVLGPCFVPVLIYTVSGKGEDNALTEPIIFVSSIEVVGDILLLFLCGSLIEF